MVTNHSKVKAIFLAMSLTRFTAPVKSEYPEEGLRDSFCSTIDAVLSAQNKR